MRIRTISFACLPALFALAACTGNDAASTKTVAATDCQAKDVVMQPTVSTTGMAWRWHVALSVNVTCRGAPLEGAELTVTYPWLLPFTVSSDTAGNASATRDATTQPQPTGSIEVSVKVADDSVTQSVAL